MLFISIIFLFFSTPKWKRSMSTRTSEIINKSIINKWIFMYPYGSNGKHTLLKRNECTVNTDTKYRVSCEKLVACYEYIVATYKNGFFIISFNFHFLCITHTPFCYQFAFFTLPCSLFSLWMKYFLFCLSKRRKTQNKLSKN